MSHPLEFLIGTWVGEGHGEYPTIASFDYGEASTYISPPGKPFLFYTQRTWALDDQRPLHAEAGYLRPVDDGARVELVMALPTGHAEVAEGAVDAANGRVRLVTTSVSAGGTAKSVTAIERDLDVDVSSGVLTYTVRMAAVGQPLVVHLTARLTHQ